MKTEAEFRVTEITENHIQTVRQLISDNPSWNRSRLSRELCQLWNWRSSLGQMKDMACRDLLLKLEQRGRIVLPRRKSEAFVRGSNISVIEVPHDTDVITGKLKDLLPLRIEAIEPGHPSWRLFKYLLYQYHYLSFNGTVGENMKYLILDNQSRPLACLLFGSAAWSCAARDDFIGWDRDTRINHLRFLTNNTRFLILPWVRIPHLASHILSIVIRRIQGDWQNKYGHSLILLETFVETDRFRGTCYKAANWRYAGDTKGRTLEMTPTPDKAEVHRVTQCQHCGVSLPTKAESFERRQVVDTPPLKLGDRAPSRAENLLRLRRLQQGILSRRCEPAGAVRPPD